MSASRRLGAMMTKNASDNEQNELLTEEHESPNGEYITTATDSTDDDGSITYIEDYGVNENGSESEEGAFFVEYVNEGDEGYQLVDEINETENDDDSQQELTDYTDNDGNEELYNCNLCGMNFKSITEHVEQYHSDQDVVIDILEESGTAIKQEDSLDGQEYDVNYGNDGETDPLAAEEMIVYGDEQMDADNTSLDEYVLENKTEVYSYDDATGSITKSTNDKNQQKQPNVKANVNSMYNCTYCDEIFTTLRSWSSHLLSKHGEEITSTPTKKTPVRTPKRNVKVTKPKPDTDNKAAARLGQDHLCEICNTNFYSAKSLKLHARMHLPVKSKTMEETTEHDLDSLATEENPREKFYCGICGKHYDKTFEEVHVQMHNGEEKFNCGICNKVFPNEESIKMHMNAHQETRVIRTKAEINNKKLPYGCQYCGKEFARPHEKVKHERVHTGEKPYECELCGKCFRVSYCLTIHMRTHTDARPYVCPHCNKRFKAQSVYNHHLLTHSDERNYKCPYCPKTFKTSVQLSGHKNSHTKPFTCTECNRPFGSLYAVRAHMESHKRSNHNLKHICDICGAKYARRFALNDHIKEQHKDVQVVQIVDNDKNASGSSKKPPPKRAKKVQHYEVIITDEQEIDVNDESILPNMVEQEITISEIEHFENEEEVSDIHWLKGE